MPSRHPLTQTTRTHAARTLEHAQTRSLSRAPQAFHATAPNLRRLAVVSAPVTDKKGERADEKLNAALIKGLEKAEAKCKAEGFK